MWTGSLSGWKIQTSSDYMQRCGERKTAFLKESVSTMRALCKASIASTVIVLAGCGPGMSAQEQAEMDALVDCQMAIKSASRNASKVEVPYVPNIGSASQFRFAWRRGDGLHMPNGFGAMEDAAALCIHQDGRIRALTIEDQVVVAR